MTESKSTRRALFISILLNIFLVLAVIFSWFYNALIGCSEIANGKLGVLKRDVQVGLFDKEERIFTLPKGLAVLDTHATGMGYFEPYRFRIVITSDDKDLVDYSSEEKAKAFNPHGNYYSAHKNKAK